MEFVEDELNYLLNGLQDAMLHGYIDAFDFNNIKAFTNLIIGHFANGEKKERLVNIMGGNNNYRS